MTEGKAEDTVRARVRLKHGSAYEALYRLVLCRFDAERLHTFSIRLLELAGNRAAVRALLQSRYQPKIATPPLNVLGLQFAHPLGMAGGFDKDGRCLNALQALGFSFVEVGTITPRPQPGSPRPRLFRLTEDQALINRMGFPSEGMAAVAKRMADYRRHSQSGSFPIGISLGKNRETPLAEAGKEYGAVLDSLYPYADFFVVNVSSPNTPELRQLQTRRYLSQLLRDLQGQLQTLSAGKRPKPLLIKLSPDLTWTELDEALDVALQNQIAGIVATNTTTQRPDLRSLSRVETGGLSGQPLRQRATEIIRYIQRSSGDRLTIIGVGGVFDADDLREKLDAGAALVQAYTGFIYRGPSFACEVLSHNI